MRVGVGVGVVMLGGCDMVSEAKARVFGEDVELAQSEVEAPAAPVAAQPAPEPMLLSRGGVAGVVEEVTRSRTAPTSELASPAPVRDLGRPFAEPEGSRAFVPYEGGVSAPSRAPSPVRVAAPSKPRKERKVARVDEPCDPGVLAATPPSTEWQCLACGRG